MDVICIRLLTCAGQHGLLTDLEPTHDAFFWYKVPCRMRPRIFAARIRSCFIKCSHKRNRICWKMEEVKNFHVSEIAKPQGVSWFWNLVTASKLLRLKVLNICQNLTSLWCTTRINAISNRTNMQWKISATLSLNAMQVMVMFCCCETNIRKMKNT